MTHEEFEKKYAEYLKIVEDRLEPRAKEVLPTSSEVGNAARYSLLSGGKRIRAILVLATCEMMGGDYHAAADLAVAVEMLHCYSLIHDDLPCMDNDDFRRGRPSCHKQFGEEKDLIAQRLPAQTGAGHRIFHRHHHRHDEKVQTHGKRRTFFQSWLVRAGEKGLHLDADCRCSSDGHSVEYQLHPGCCLHQLLPERTAFHRRKYIAHGDSISACNQKSN